MLKEATVVVAWVVGTDWGKVRKSRDSVLQDVLCFLRRPPPLRTGMRSKGEEGAAQQCESAAHCSPCIGTHTDNPVLHEVFLPLVLVLNNRYCKFTAC
jgi:hypothetical protein